MEVVVVIKVTNGVLFLDVEFKLDAARGGVGYAELVHDH